MFIFFIFFYKSLNIVNYKCISCLIIINCLGNLLTQSSNQISKTRWSSTFAFLMAMIGSAVGLGNIWRFN